MSFYFVKKCLCLRKTADNLPKIV